VRKALSTRAGASGLIKDDRPGCAGMRDQPCDKSSKWLIEHQARGILRLGGLRGVRQYRAGPAQIVQPSKLSDGLLEVTLDGRNKPLLVLIEVATYPDKRAERQALEDLTLAYHVLGRLPELLMLVLRPKGRYRISGKYAIRSELGWSGLEGEWKPVELWTLSAEEHLAGDVGGVPWVPLMQYEGPPEALLERCREKIEREAHPKDQPTLKAVAQVLARLKFPAPDLWSLLGGKAVMIESPLIKELQADACHDMILELLKARFGPVPRDVRKLLRAVLDEKKLKKLNVSAARCPDMEAFRKALLS
jgi:hypothetical protein